MVRADTYAFALRDRVCAVAKADAPPRKNALRRARGQASHADDGAIALIGFIRTSLRWPPQLRAREPRNRPSHTPRKLRRRRFSGSLASIIGLTPPRATPPVVIP